MELPSPGTQLGHYRIEEKLGEGGMGVVYRARDTRLQRDVALKLLAEHSPSDAAHEHLLAEARAASALNHPNIATVYDAGEAAGRGYIAMELVEGRPLNKQIPQDGMPAEAVLRYGMQIAAALAHAHDRGVIHRDLKSANVVITPEGQAKVLDFGLAGRVESAIAEATRSVAAAGSSGSVAGTLHYMAPEVLRGEPGDARSDIWALGVVLYEMAAGKLPFEGRTGFELSSAILRESLPPLPAQVPPGIRGVIQRCLAKDPGHRYRSAGQVHAALEAISSTADLPVSPVRETAAVEKPRRRMATWMPLMAGLIVVGAIALIALWPKKSAVPPEQGVAVGPGGANPASGQGVGAFVIQKPSANAEANELLQRAMMHTRYQLDPLKARPMLERALQLDPGFNEARVNYALTFIVAVEVGLSNDPGDIYRAEEELRRVIRDDPDIPRAHGLLGAVHFFQGRLDLAMEQTVRARQLSERDLSGRMWRAVYGQFEGNSEDALSAALEVVKAEPLFWPPRNRAGELLREQGKTAEAIQEQEKVLGQDPKNVAALRCLARAYLDAGRLALAREALEQVSPENRSNFRVRLTRAQFYALDGKRELARKELDEQVLKYADLSPLATLDAAEIYSLLGEKEKAIDWLDRSMRKGDGRAEWYQRDPLLANVRNHPRFKQILDSMQFRRQQRTR